MTHPEHVRCTRCGGTGQMKPTALDRLDLAEQGHMDLQCLLCDGTGRLPWPVTHMWCGRCRIVSDDTVRCDVCGGSDLQAAYRPDSWIDADHYRAVVCHRCDGSGLTDLDHPDDLCGACEGAGMTRQDGELL